MKRWLEEWFDAVMCVLLITATLLGIVLMLSLVVKAFLRCS